MIWSDDHDGAGYGKYSPPWRLQRGFLQLVCPLTSSFLLPIGSLATLGADRSSKGNTLNALWPAFHSHPGADCEATERSRPIRRKISRNSLREIATSAIWNVTYRMYERGVFVFRRYCELGSSKWIEAKREADGRVVILWVGKPVRSKTIPNLRRRPYRIVGKVRAGTEKR